MDTGRSPEIVSLANAAGYLGLTKTALRGQLRAAGYPLVTHSGMHGDVAIEYVLLSHLQAAFPGRFRPAEMMAKQPAMAEWRLIPGDPNADTSSGKGRAD